MCEDIFLPFLPLFLLDQFLMFFFIFPYVQVSQEAFEISTVFNSDGLLGDGSVRHEGGVERFRVKEALGDLLFIFHLLNFLCLQGDYLVTSFINWLSVRSASPHEHS